jgi:amidase
MSAIHDMTALEQAAAVRAGDVSATELVTHYLGRIREADGGIGAFVTVTEELALAQAAAAERDLAQAQRTGRAVSALHGVPVAIKDVARIEDVRHTQGSAVYADEVADIDDHVVARIKGARLVILGTTNTPEFALPCYTENEIAPATRNPWSREHSPGGSSGGSAAAVAARLAPIAHGTDAGGSVRIPASACGVVGLKPSRGRVSNGPIDHEVTGLSVHGALGRSVADTAALLEVMSGVMPGDTFTAPPDSGPLGAGEAGGGGDRYRIAVMPEPMVPGVSAHADCLEALARVGDLLRDAGHSVEEVEMSPDQGVADAFARAWSVNAASIFVDEDEEELLTPFTRYMRELGREVTGLQLHTALSTFRGIGQMLADLFFATYDLILTPTLAKPPARIGEFSSDGDQAADYDRMTAFMPYTPMYNIAGLPAISVPAHVNSEGLPIGVMVGGRYGDERSVLTLAAEIEARVGWVASPAPAVHGMGALAR